MVFGRIWNYLTYSPLMTLYTFFCATVLCVVFQLGFLKRANIIEGSSLSVKHFISVYVFLFYLMLVYTVTGIGTVWIIGKYKTLIRVGQIHLIPFADFESVVPYLLNILMTMPFGFMLPLIWVEFRSLKKVALTGLLFSLAIELSQLLTLRAVTVEDLIMNTLGAVIGYFVFKCLYMIFHKGDGVKPLRNSLLPIIRHEAIIYLVCSFIGMFLFFDPLAYVHFQTPRVDIKESIIESQNTAVSIDERLNLDESIKESVNSGETTDASANTGEDITESPDIEDSIDENPDTADYLKGMVLEISEDTIRVEKTLTLETETGLISVDTKEEITVFLNDGTDFELWRSDAGGAIAPIISEVTANAIFLNGIVEIYGKEDGEGFSADKIIIWKFDVR